MASGKDGKMRWRKSAPPSHVARGEFGGLTGGG